MEDPNDAYEHEKDHAPLEKNFRQLSAPFQLFLRSQYATGVLLLLSTIIAIVLANSNFRDLYQSINHLPFGLLLGDSQIKFSLHHWVNDGLMVLYFFLLGLEIKRERLVGDLSDIRHVKLVVFMAMGGMVAPALVYLAFTHSSPELTIGWGIPMATDTAFALGILALLRSRAPKAVALVLSALAIVDDIGAVLIIGLFYTAELQWGLVLAGLGIIGGMFTLNILGVRHPLAYLVCGLLLWWCILHSGVHATTAGILAALTVPARPRAQTSWFIRNMKGLVKQFEAVDHPEKTILEDGRQHRIAEEARNVALHATTESLKEFFDNLAEMENKQLKIMVDSLKHYEDI